LYLQFIEAHDGSDFNWGKFAIGRFTHEEWAYRSALDPTSFCTLLRGRGWDERHVLVLDLQTGEGSIFLPGGLASHDLNNKHKLWVCPMFEPFLTWLYKQDLSDLTKLPAVVNLGDVPTAMYGYRRLGQEAETKDA